MMRLESNGYFGLDAVGRRIWELLDEPRTVDGSPRPSRRIRRTACGVRGQFWAF